MRVSASDGLVGSITGRCSRKLACTYRPDLEERLKSSLTSVGRAANLRSAGPVLDARSR